MTARSVRSGTKSPARSLYAGALSAGLAAACGLLESVCSQVVCAVHLLSLSLLPIPPASVIDPSSSLITTHTHSLSVSRVCLSRTILPTSLAEKASSLPKSSIAFKSARTTCSLCKKRIETYHSPSRFKTSESLAAPGTSSTSQTPVRNPSDHVRRRRRHHARRLRSTACHGSQGFSSSSSRRRRGDEGKGEALQVSVLQSRLFSFRASLAS